jgi:transposase InsO family protein
MLLSLLYFAVCRLLHLLFPRDDDSAAREIEILVLRHQLRVLSRGRRLPLKRGDRILLAAASRFLPRELWRCFPVSPQTVLRWHRELVRRKWTHRHGRRPGRPRIARETAALVLKLAKENPRWGYPRIQGEMKKLGVSISATAICTLLRRHGFRPAPRHEGPSWKEFLSQQAAGVIACDFFCVETVWLKTVYVLFFIELATRRVYLAGVTAHPNSAWVTQQARNLAIEGRLAGIKFLIRDRDAKYSGPFDEVFRSEGVGVIRSSIRAPRANAFAERFVRSARRECLDHILVLGERHLERVLREYVRHYNTERPHRGLSLETPEPKPLPSSADGEIVRVARLGGLINEYHRIAA